jgi:hypothetical protein
MIGRPPMNKWNGHFSRLSHLRWRSPQRLVIGPPVCRRYRFPSIAMNAANSDIGRLPYRRSEVVTISGATDRLRPGGIARRCASNRSLGSGWSLDWTSMTEIELTAENRPA